MNPAPRRLLINTLANAFNMLVRIGMSFVMAPLLIGGLGADEYALWILAGTFSLGSLFSLLDLGLQQATVKFVAERMENDRRAEINSVYTLSLLLYGVLGLIAASLVGALVIVGPQHVLSIAPEQLDLVRQLLTLVCGSLVLEFLGMAITGVVRGTNRLDVVRHIETVTGIGWLATVVLLLSLQFSVAAILVANISFIAVRVIALRIVARSLLPGLHLTREVVPGLWQDYRAYVRQIAIMKFASFVWLSVDKVLIATVLGASLLALYDVAYKLHQLVYYGMYLVSHAVLPVAASLHAAKDLPGQRRLLVDATKYTLALAMPAVCFSLILADPFIPHWVGAEWAHAVPLARLYLLHFFVASLGPIGAELLQGRGQLRPVVRAAVLSAVVNLVLSVSLVAEFGLYGLAIGTLCASILSTLVVLHAVLHELQMGAVSFLRRSVGAVYPALIVSSGGLLLVTQWRQPVSLTEVVIHALIAMVLFMALFAWWGLSPEERLALRDRWRRRRAASFASEADPGPDPEDLES